MVNDIVSDMITRIRNASLVKAPKVYVPYTKLTFGIAEILKKENFIQRFEIKSGDSLKKDCDFLCLFLKYRGIKKFSYITSLKRISKPGLRVYVNSVNVKKVLGGVGISILSTSQGLMTDREARSRKIGGEVLCDVW
jgi:small subunit ribosomal protein S8|nr:ribosomal protein S8 [Eutreptiella sp. CCMP1594]